MSFLLHNIAEINIILSASMFGVIWLVQLVHYPSFLYIEKEKFEEFEKFHMFRISLVVVPLMIFELLTAVLLQLKISEQIVMIHTALVIFIWVYTFLVSSKIHGELTKGFDSGLIKKLVTSNWPRTIAWSLKLIFAYMVYIGGA